MTRRKGVARHGFTLIELLVVIAIIGLLMGLLLPALSGVRVRAKEADNSTHLRQVENAVNQFHSKTKVDYIPSHGGLHNGAGLVTANSSHAFRFRAQYPVSGGTLADPDQNSFEAVYLKQVFPQLNLLATGLPRLDADPNQTLTFFLTGISLQGFSNNKQQPFNAPLTAGETRIGPFLEMKQEYLDASGTRLVDKFGIPFAYFSSYAPPTGRFDYGASLNPPLSQTYGAAGTAYPFYTAGTPNRYLNAKSFQIITAGRDKLFGAGGAWVPGEGNYAPNNAGHDDFSNFNKLRLGVQE